jgi:two-component system sensor histidine kinase EvgS
MALAVWGLSASPSPLASLLTLPLAGADGEGYGLGLTVARQMARLIGGDLTVASEVGKGSQFSLALPASLVPATQ